MEKTITVKELINEYDKRVSNEVKQVYLKSAIKAVDFISYAIADVEAENMVKASSYDKDLNLQINSSKRYLLYVATIINDYTNIKIDPENFVNEYDELRKRGIYDYIINIIPKEVLNQLDAVIDMKLNDLMTNEYNTQAYINKQLIKLYPYIGEGLKGLVDVLNNVIKNLDINDLNDIIKNLSNDKK